MISFRGFLYFVIGVLIAASASFSFAGSLAYSPGHYSRTSTFGPVYRTYGNSANDMVADTMTTMVDGRSIVVNDFLRVPANETVRVPVNDVVRIDRGVVENMAKGVARGAAGAVGAIAVGIITDWLVQKGWQWMNDAQCVAAAACWEQGTQVVKNCKDGYGQWMPGVWYGGYSSYVCAASLSQLTTVLSSQYGTNWRVTNNCTQTSSTDYSCVVQRDTGSGYQNWSSIDVHLKPGSLGSNYTTTYKPVPDTDIDNEIQNASGNSSFIQNLFNAMHKEGDIFSIADTTPAQATFQNIADLPHTISESYPLSDGGTGRRITTQTDIFGGKSGQTAGEPFTVGKIETTTTTTEQTCTGDGSCSVTNNTTTTKTNPVPEQTPQTPCQENPNSAGCTDLGTPSAAAIPTDSREYTYSPSNYLSMPSACPAPVTFSVMGRSYSLSYDPICQFATYIRALVIISALIAAYFICFGARKEEI